MGQFCYNSGILGTARFGLQSIPVSVCGHSHTHDRRRKRGGAPRLPPSNPLRRRLPPDNQDIAPFLQSGSFAPLVLSPPRAPDRGRSCRSPRRRSPASAKASPTPPSTSSSGQPVRLHLLSAESPRSRSRSSFSPPHLSLGHSPLAVRTGRRSSAP